MAAPWPGCLKQDDAPLGYLVYILAVAAGVSIPVQSAANSALDKGVGQAGAVLLIVYGVALLGSLESLPVLGLLPRRRLRESIRLAIVGLRGRIVQFAIRNRCGHDHAEDRIRRLHGYHAGIGRDPLGRARPFRATRISQA